MKKIYFSVLAILSVSTLNALTFICGEPKKDSYDINEGVYSKLLWTTDTMASYGQAKMLPTPPGARDKAVIRNRWKVKVDKDVKVGTFSLETINEVRFEKGKTLATVKDLDIRLVLMGDSFIEFDSGKANIGGSLDMGSRDPVDALGTAGVRLIDSTMNIAGNIFTPLQFGNFENTREDGGIRLYLKGKSFLNVAGIILPDPQYKESNNISFQINFEESEGNIPVVTMGEGDMTGVKFSLIIKNAKKGVYPLVIVNDRKGTAQMKAYSVNRRPIKIGEEFSIGDSTAVLKLAGGGKDVRTPNDLILEVK